MIGRKHIISAVALILLLIGNSHAMAQKSDENMIDGLWRGELVVQKGVKLAIGITVSNNNTTLTLNSPNQGMYKREPSSFSIAGKRITFTDEGLNASFEGEIKGDTIVGTFTQGKDMPLTLHKLNDTDLARMKFEGSYSGDLIINANSSLPLVLHVAVIKDGYSAALDSPAQNSNGIPISEVDINDEALSFTSTMLGAKFSGNKQDDGYKGTFIQGMPMELTLTRVSDKNAHLQFTPAEFDEQGGSIAVINNNKIERKFYNEHNANTQYEIGSITKTITAYVLASQVVNEQIKLNTTVDTFFGGSPAISMQQLATHVSGLERNPPSLMTASDMNNPFADITQQNLSTDLAAITLAKGPHKHEYSNFAYAVLGEALAINKQSGFSKEVVSTLFTPLGMNNSYVADVNISRSKQFAQGHNSMGETVAPWTLNAASGAGAVVSTLDDMIKYTQHVMAEVKNDTALAKTLFTPYTNMSACCEQALGWILLEDKQGKTYAWHNGMTGGFSAFMGFYLDGSRAIVMLNNQASSFDNKAHALLANEIDLTQI